MTNKEWALANLTGKVLNRAMRAIEEQDFNVEGERHSIMCLFDWLESKEGPDYWYAVSVNRPKPDQHLPSDYLEAPEYVGEVKAKTYTEAEAKHIFKQAQECSVKADGVYFKYETFEKLKNSNQ